MASTSATSVHKRFKYDVFLSFRGEDTRKNFVDHLYHALQHKGIITFKDDERIQEGERISDQLIRSIEESRIHIIIFSKNYASSSWCLEELVKIMECQIMGERTAYPVFYNVEPTEVRDQSGAFGEAFARHVEKDAVGRWRDALKEATYLAGWDPKNTADGHEAKFVQKVVQDISKRLRFGEKLVGIETRVNNVVTALENGFNDVRIVGIKGMKGSGKTALARAVFNHISILFEGISFVENVSKISKGPGLKELQNKILSEVLNDQSIVVSNASDGKIMMKKMMRSRKVLVVLDDVDDIKQLEALAGEPNWFKAGSRIIITTRDEQACIWGRFPAQRYEELTRKVVPCAAGLPLTIIFLASFLSGRTQRAWVDTIQRLKAMPLKETLELRYKDLEDRKEVILDDACIMRGQDKYIAMRIQEIYGVDAQIIKQNSSVMVSDTDHLRVHDHIEEADRYFDRGLHPHKPYKRNQLRIREETKDTMVNNLGIEELEDTDLQPDKRLKALKNTKELNFLCVDDNKQVKWNIDEVGQYLPNTLRSLYWRHYPFSCLPETFQANHLINLEMNGSNISQLWEAGVDKVLENLRFLDLSNSKIRIFDLGMTPNLETLRLEKCFDFEELHMPSKCPKLKFLNLTVSKLSSLNLRLIPNLEGLYLEECNDVLELHMPVNPPKLKLLEVSGSKVSHLWLTPHLEKLENLEELTLSIKEIKHLPDSIFVLKHLKYLKLKCCLLLEKLPQDLDRLECLEELYLTDCTSLRDIPNNVCKVKRLKHLHLPHCILVQKLPEELGRLECLKELNIEGTRISHLPQSILKLKGVCIVWSKRKLESYGFRSLKEISRNTASAMCSGE